MERHASLAALRDAYKGCRACFLGTTGARFVFGMGDEAAKVLVVGEAPGFHEDKQGEPFVGAAGKLLDELLTSIGLSRRPGGGAYIANVIKHRPPDNRDPGADEIAACAPILDEQIRILDPAVIVTVGNFASRYILETEAGITKIRGRVFHRAGRAVFPTFHPAAALRSTAVEAQLKSDFAALRRVLDDRLPGGDVGEAGEAAAAAAALEPPAPPVEQMNLFE